MRLTSVRPRGESGFSMLLVVMVMFVTSMFVAAAFAAANGDLPISGQSKDRKEAYAAAEAGMNFYLSHIQQDNDYWTKCDSVPAPNSTELNPVNQQWDGAGADPRRWRNVAGARAQYTIELLHTAGYTKCETDPTKQASMIDLASGTFKIRITGRAYATSPMKRSIVATFRRDGFLNFIYFTNFEDVDPQAYALGSDRTAAQTNCADKYRSVRAGKGCDEIQFVSGDSVAGPLHTNDDNLLLCGSPVFGRPLHVDTVEVAGAAPGYAGNGGSCGASPTINTPTGKFTANSKPLDVPTSNQSLLGVAQVGGTVYSGKTIIRLKGNVMDVTNYNAAGVGTTSTNVPFPVNGVLYVTNNGTCTSEYPLGATYTEPAACGNVYVSGTYSTSLTINAENDVIIRPTVGGSLTSGSADADLIGTNDAMLGLIANNFVRVGHKVNARSDPTDCNGNYTTSLKPNPEPTVKDITIQAAILSLQHSFIVDNYDCGRLGTLTVKGAIAQNYRGPVGTGSGSNPVTGFLKAYTYDDRFLYRSPPYFLNPVDSAWDVVRVHEQVPAR